MSTETINKTVLGSDIVFYTGDKNSKISVNEMNDNIKTLQDKTQGINHSDNTTIINAPLKLNDVPIENYSLNTHTHSSFDNDVTINGQLSVYNHAINYGKDTDNKFIFDITDKNELTGTYYNSIDSSSVNLFTLDYGSLRVNNALNIYGDTCAYLHMGDASNSNGYVFSIVLDDNADDPQSKLSFGDSKLTLHENMIKCNTEFNTKTVSFNEVNSEQWEIEPFVDKLFLNLKHIEDETVASTTEFYIDGSSPVKCLNTNTFDDITCNRLNGYNLANANGGVTNVGLPDYPFIPTIKADSVLEIGRYIDMHASNNDTDFTTRVCAYDYGISLQCTTDTDMFYIGRSSDRTIINIGTGSNYAQLAYIDGTQEKRLAISGDGGSGPYLNIYTDIAYYAGIMYLDGLTFTYNHNILTKPSPTLVLKANGAQSLAIAKPVDGTYKNLISFGVALDTDTCVVKESGLKGGTFLDFKRTDSSTDHEWRMITHSNHCLVFYNYKNENAGYISCGGNSRMNTTITHNAPITESLDNYEIGAPVFISGEVYNLKDGKYTTETTPTDCIPSVKSTGTFKEFIGIVVKKHPSGDKVTVGDVMKCDVVINQDTIDFATHGDFYFKVSDVNNYEIGDIVLFDGNKVDMDLKLTPKITSSIVGKVTGKVGTNMLTIFKE